MLAIATTYALDLHMLHRVVHSITTDYVYLVWLITIAIYKKWVNIVKMYIKLEFEKESRIAIKSI